jgi:hypothetical protein
MATINLGNIKFNWQGAYAGGTAYAVDDVVSYNGSSYICKLASTGNLPTNTTYWDQMSQKGTDADLLSIASTAQGDIYYNNGGAIARLGAGTSGYFLKTQGAGANPTWAEIDGGAIKQIKQVMYSGQDTFSSTTYVPITNFAVTITPTASNSSFLIMATIQSGHSNNDSASGYNIFDSQVGTSNGNEIFPNGVSSGSRKRSFQTGKFGLNSIGSVNDYINWQTNISAMYTPSSNNANARIFTVATFNPNTTMYMNYSTADSGAGMSTVSNMIVMEIANGIYS